ncbi:MAG: hypothetical protein E7640_00545 [Ruminococcaceae bacterium]|nr:hypothetical protein [Oscillospiraceae bacterium]
MMTDKNPGAVGRAKKSLFRSQMRAIAFLLAALILLGVVTGVVLYIVRQDIDTYREVLSYGSDRNDTYISYFSRRDGDSFAVFDEDGNKLTPFEYEKKICYETRAGTILTLDAGGMFQVIAMLDNGDGETVNSSNTALLLYQRLERSEIKSIEAVNDKGGYTVYSIKSDTDGDGKKETNFFIKDYENSPIDPVILSGIVTRCGILSLNVKLDRDTMLAEDEKHKNDAGYQPIINADGSVNLSIYGLAETYEEIDGESGEPVTKTTPYFILSDVYGNVHKIYIGDMTSDGNHYYLRYENIASAVLDSATASASEKEAERKKLESISKNVYLILKDPSGVSGYTSDVEKTMLASAAEISAPTVIMPYTTSNSYDVRDFTVQRKDGEDYKKVISFTYNPLELRMNTVSQDFVYHIEDAEGLGLVGYELDNDRTFDAIFALIDISSAASSSSASTVDQTVTSVNYIKTVALVTSRVNDLSGITEEIIENDAEIRSALKALDKYGVLDAEFILSFDMPEDINDADSEIISQTLLISKKTENDTYYVWSPRFSQIVEIGKQYLYFLEYDGFDWVDRDMMHTSITFSDGMHIKAGDLDVLFKIYDKITVNSRNSFIIPNNLKGYYNGYYDVNTVIDENWNRTISVKSNVVYTGTYADGSTQELTHSSDLFSADLSVVENYCRRLLGDPLTGLSSDDIAAMNKYASSLSGKSVANGVVTLTHKIYAPGDQYQYVNNTNYYLTFTYSGENLSLSSRVEGQSSRLLYDSEIFSDYYAYYIDDRNNTPSLSEDELEAVEEFFMAVNRVSSEQTRVTVSVSGGEPFDMGVAEYKELYKKLLQISFYGRADEADTSGGNALSSEEMESFAASDDAALTIDFYLSVGEDLVFRSYDYSSTKSYTTINRHGKFYINKITKDAFVRAVEEIANK